MIVAARKQWTTIDGRTFRSPLEARFWSCWRRFYPDVLLVPQYRVVKAQGKPHVDFALPGTMIAVEIDGAAWHNNPVDAEKDRLRDLALNACGWQVVRVTGAEMRTVRKVVEKVWAEVEACRGEDREVMAR